MELDDLKKSWRQSGEQIKAPQKDIRQLIQAGSDHPLVKLKRRFRKGMLLMPAIAAIIAIEFSHKKDFESHFASWYLLSFCAIMMVYFFVNYRLVSKMLENAGNVHANLVHQTKTLSQFLKIRLILMRGAVALFFVLHEVLKYLYSDEGHAWQASDLFRRLPTYLFVFILFFFFTRIAMNHRYRKNIQQLQQLVKEMEEE